MEKSPSSPGFRRLARIADQMTPDLMACAEHATAAERAGSAAEALEWHRAVPMYQRGRHCAVLTRLAQLGDDLPPWVRARWLVYQSLRCEDPGSKTARMHRAALKYAMESVHADLVDECFEEGGDPIRVAARVVGESWFFHQLFAYEAKGLLTYLDEFIGGPFGGGAELARQWASVPLDGYRVGESLAGARLRVYDPITDEPTELLALGARSCASEGGWVVGRLVPSGLDGGRLFDTPPLAVSEQTAVEVAAERRRQPWRPLTAALEEGRLAPRTLMREDLELLTDVQELDLLAYGTPAHELARVTDQLRQGRDEIGRAAFRVLRGAVAGDVPDLDVAFVAAAALNPFAHGEALAKLCHPGSRDAWLQWAALAPEPGHRRLLTLARASAVAA